MRAATIPGTPHAQSPGGQEGGGSGWVRVLRARDDIEAALATGLLEAEGIETRTVKDRTGLGEWAHAGRNPFAPVDVYVRGFDYEQARFALVSAAFYA